MGTMISKRRPATPEAVKADAQSREGSRGGKEPSRVNGNRKASLYELTPALFRAARMKPYERRGDVPLYRPLRIYLLDPGASRMEGAVGLVNVPFEPIALGPSGSVLSVKKCGTLLPGCKDELADITQEYALLQAGRDPSPSDPQFHQQMVYAVSSLVYATFRSALGRQLSWGFEPRGKNRFRLAIHPHAVQEENAYYEKETGSLKFGYYPAVGQASGRTAPGEMVFTCLSHDIIAHEMTHAILDGLRPCFALPTSVSVSAFHEGFADLVAIFQHFSYPEVVANAIGKTRGDMGSASLLFDLARQFGHTTQEGKGPLRTAIDWFAFKEVEGGGAGDEQQIAKPQRPRLYSDVSEIHQLGSVLVSAVFEAFVVVFRRKTRRYFRLASGGTGVLPPGEIPADLQSILAGAASRLASQFLSMAIRAIDYCPPVDVNFADYLRALITADYDLVPDDPWGYREALIDAFRRRGIYPQAPASLDEGALRWKPPRKRINRIPEISFSRLRFRGDPGHVMSRNEIERQGRALGDALSDPQVLDELSLGVPGTQKDSAMLGPIEIQSLRTARRVGPDGQIVFDLVAEVVQRCTVGANGSQPGFDVLGGATLIFGPRGDIRYVVSKRSAKQERVAAMAAFLKTKQGHALWAREGDKLVPKPSPWRLVHLMGKATGEGRKKAAPAESGRQSKYSRHR